MLLPGGDHHTSLALDVAGRREVRALSEFDEGEKTDDHEEDDDHGDEGVDVATEALAGNALEEIDAELVDAGDYEK